MQYFADAFENVHSAVVVSEATTTAEPNVVSTKVCLQTFASHAKLAVPLSQLTEHFPGLPGGEALAESTLQVV